MDGLNLKTALFTNLSRDHLDYHKTFKDYLNSKLILFNKLLLNKGNIIFENGISQEKELNKISKKKKLKTYKIGNENSFINLKKIQKINDKKRIHFSLLKKDYSFSTSYNVSICSIDEIILDSSKFIKLMIFFSYSFVLLMSIFKKRINSNINFNVPFNLPLML